MSKVNQFADYLLEAELEDLDELRDDSDLYKLYEDLNKGRTDKFKLEDL